MSAFNSTSLVFLCDDRIAAFLRSRLGKRSGTFFFCSPPVRGSHLPDLARLPGCLPCPGLHCSIDNCWMHTLRGTPETTLRIHDLPALPYYILPEDGDQTQPSQQRHMTDHQQIQDKPNPRASRTLSAAGTRKHTRHACLARNLMDARHFLHPRHRGTYRLLQCLPSYTLKFVHVKCIPYGVGMR